MEFCLYRVHMLLNQQQIIFADPNARSIVLRKFVGDTPFIEDKTDTQRYSIGNNKSKRLANIH